eukprot:TRINITY_DN7175_c0_g1_i6.p1 TRINITY_DN7175_c0_g1~~TRINITY_DN7175_c0_g1_i6.p1  ORF type:complete len:283 (+),score=42.99 TRINITY_DN7175_c0_g1_i6:176-1024(+)
MQEAPGWLKPRTPNLAPLNTTQHEKPQTPPVSSPGLHRVGSAGPWMSECERRVVEHLVPKMLSSECIAGMRSLFGLMDRDGDGLVSGRDFSSPSVASVHSALQTMWNQIVWHLDADGDGVVSQDDFMYGLSWVALKQPAQDPRELAGEAGMNQFMLLADHLNQATAQAINSVYQFLGANGDLVPVHPLTPRLDNPSVLHRAASVAHVMSPDEQALISNMWQFSSAMSRTDSTGNCSCPPLIDCRAVALTTAHAKIQRAWGLLDLNSKGQVAVGHDCGDQCGL